jgi:hypothetical protein
MGAALTLPLALMCAFAAQARAEGTTCSQNGGRLSIKPGLTESAQVQTVKVTGFLRGCTAGFESATYTATLKTAEPVTCATVMTGGGVPASGPLIIKWKPHSEAGHSRGTFSMPLSAMSPVSVAGTLESGPFAGRGISTAVSQSYGPSCEEVKKIKKGSFEGSAFEVS